MAEATACGTHSLANYTAETGFAPATYDVFVEVPLTAVDRANLDFVLPQTVALQTFVRALPLGVKTHPAWTSCCSRP